MISLIRKKNNISQKELAKLIGATQSYIAKIENGKANPTNDIILKLSIALNCCPIIIFIILNNEKIKYCSKCHLKCHFDI